VLPAGIAEAAAARGASKPAEAAAPRLRLPEAVVGRPAGDERVGGMRSMALEKALERLAG
jgi:hypothetical protein